MPQARAADLERLRRDPAFLAILQIYIQMLICWFRISFGRLKCDVERDMAKIRKRLRSAELVQDPPSRPEAPRSAESQQKEQTAADGRVFRIDEKHYMFLIVRAHRGLDFKKTSKQLQSGKLFRDLGYR